MPLKLLKLRLATQEGDAELARAAMRGISRLLDSDEQQDKLLALRALSNAGVPSIVPQVRPYLGHPEPEFRSAATKALMRLSTQEVEPVILAALAGENVYAQLSALRYLRERSEARSKALRRGVTTTAERGAGEVAQRANALLDSWQLTG